MQDAADFVEAIKEVACGGKDLSKVINEYDETMRTRGSREAQTSLDQTLMSHDWKTLMASPIVKMGAHQQKSD